MKRLASNPLVTFIVVFMLWNLANAKTEESMEVRVFDRDFQASNIDMRKMLQKADLESYGYKKEVVTKLISEPGTDKPIYENTYYFYKMVDCSRVRDIDKELNNIIPGIFGVGVVTKINKEIKSKHLDAMKQCKVGLEVHFKDSGGCNDIVKENRRRTRRGCSWHLFCWSSKFVA